MNGEEEGQEVLLKDGVHYIDHQYSDEAELEEVFAEHVGLVFGSSALLFRKRRLKSQLGVGSIPDAFVLDLESKEWFVVEVELADHPLYEHVVNQISRFRAGISNPDTNRQLVTAFYNEIKEDIDKETAFAKKQISEIHKFVSDTIEKQPTVVIVIDRLERAHAEVIESVPFDTRLRELRTYYRKGHVAEDHIHRVLPLGSASFISASPPSGRDIAPEPPRNDTKRRSESQLLANHSHKRPRSFTFHGMQREVSTWKDVFLGVCEMLYARHRDDYGRIFEIQGRKRPYFARQDVNMREAREIGDSGIYAETHASANNLTQRTAQVLKLFGYSPDEVQIEEV